MPYSCCEVEVDTAYVMEQYIGIYKQYIGEENQLMFLAGVSLVSVLLLLLIWKLISAGKVKRRGIIITGISGAGKTTILSQALAGKETETVISLKENQGIYTTEKGVLNLVDIPGAEAIRQKFFDRFKDTGKGIVFVIDSDSFSNDLKDVAEYLFTILTDKVIVKNSPAVLIACNKQDLVTAKSKKLIQDQLAKELNTVRKTRSAALSSTDGQESSVSLGVKGKDFEFAHLGKINVDFVDCNAKGDSEGESRLDEVMLWINKLV